MFGYVRPLECELKVRELSVYRAYYCGVCRSIGARCGQCARLTLQYDCAFLALLLAALSDEAPAMEGRLCGVHPQRGRRPCAAAHPAVDYAADVNVLLGYHQLLDDWRDERRIARRALALALRGAVSRTRTMRPALEEAICGGLSRLDAVERARPACTDEPADAFGGLLRAVALSYPELETRAREPVAWLFYNLGRWIYLADAWQDRADDAAAGRYNAFTAAGASVEDAEFLLNYSLSEACKAFDLLELRRNASLLEHILRLGCNARTRALLKGEANEPL